MSWKYTSRTSQENTCVNSGGDGVVVFRDVAAHIHGAGGRWLWRRVCAARWLPHGPEGSRALRSALATGSWSLRWGAGDCSHEAEAVPPVHQTTAAQPSSSSGMDSHRHRYRAFPSLASSAPARTMAMVIAVRQPPAHPPSLRGAGSRRLRTGKRTSQGGQRSHSAHSGRHPAHSPVQRSTQRPGGGRRVGAGGAASVPRQGKPRTEVRE